MTSKKSHQARSGAATVEFALVGPIVILMVMAGIDLVRLHVAQNTAQTVAYESAKMGLTPGVTEDQIIEEAQSSLSIFCAKQSEVSVESETVGVSADSVTVRVAIPMKNNSWLLGTSAGFITANCTVFANRGRSPALDHTIEILETFEPGYSQL